MRSSHNTMAVNTSAQKGSIYHQRGVGSHFFFLLSLMIIVVGFLPNVRGATYIINQKSNVTYICPVGSTCTVAAGPAGPQGPKGDTGSSGYTPVKGVDYFDGLPGAKGDTGSTGATGLAGRDGRNGTDATVAFDQSLNTTADVAFRSVVIRNQTANGSYVLFQVLNQSNDDLFRVDNNGELWANGAHVCTNTNGYCATSSTGNPFDQSLNTTDNVTFHDGIFNGSALNITGYGGTLGTWSEGYSTLSLGPGGVGGLLLGKDGDMNVCDYTQTNCIDIWDTGTSLYTQYGWINIEDDGFNVFMNGKPIQFLTTSANPITLESDGGGSIALSAQDISLYPSANTNNQGYVRIFTAGSGNQLVQSQTNHQQGIAQSSRIGSPSPSYYGTPGPSVALDPSLITTDQYLQFPDKSGTIALLDDVTGGNASWNQTLADTLYQPVGSYLTSEPEWEGNASLYYLKTNPGGYFNSTNDGAGSGLDADLLDGVQGTSYVQFSALPGAVGDNITKAYVSGAVGQNLTYALITAANGNWTADKASYDTIAVRATVGNWTADKSNYLLIAAQAWSNTTYAISAGSKTINTTSGVQATQYFFGFDNDDKINMTVDDNLDVYTNGAKRTTFDSSGNFNISGGGAIYAKTFTKNQALCWTTGGKIGTCSTTVNSSGGCTCA